MPEHQDKSSLSVGNKNNKKKRKRRLMKEEKLEIFPLESRTRIETSN